MKWQPGDVAMVSLAYRGEVLAMYMDGGAWETPYAESDGRTSYKNHRRLTARPLVVIDSEDPKQVERLARAYIATWHAAGSKYEPHPGTVEIAARQMQAALREFADPKPPKPDEPTGLGAVVVDAEGDKWIRAARLAHGWHRPMGTWATWSDFDAVKVLSEGVTP